MASPVRSSTSRAAGGQMSRCRRTPTVRRQRYALQHKMGCILYYIRPPFLLQDLYVDGLSAVTTVARMGEHRGGGAAERQQREMHGCSLRILKRLEGEMMKGRILTVIYIYKHALGSRRVPAQPECGVACPRAHERVSVRGDYVTVISWPVGRIEHRPEARRRRRRPSTPLVSNIELYGGSMGMKSAK